jgi:hypothetical protein
MAFSRLIGAFGDSIASDRRSRSSSPLRDSRSSIRPHYERTFAPASARLSPLNGLPTPSATVYPPQCINNYGGIVKFRKAVFGVAIAGSTLLAAAAPSSAFFCGNANKKPGAGAAELKESFNPNAAENSTFTGAYFDVGEDLELFVRNGLHPAADVGSPDHGIVEIFSE